MTLRPTVGVYLGAKAGNNKAFENSVIQLGEGLVQCGHDLVYGGASIGLMGLLAKTVKSHGGHVTGVITKHLLNEEIAFHQADELIVVDSMYERKKLIHEKSSRFIVMAGGLGTFDEFFETWCQIKIGVLKKQIGFVNTDGYFDTLIQFMGWFKKVDFSEHWTSENLPSL